MRRSKDSLSAFPESAASTIAANDASQIAPGSI
jgi:hypothetical protein